MGVAIDVGMGDGGAGGKFGVGITGQTHFVRQQGQVGHGGGQVQLEFGLGTPEVPCLTNAQLDQPC